MRIPLVLAALLLTACESRFPVGSAVPDFEATATALAETSVVPTAPLVLVPEITLVAVSTQIDQAEDGWSTLAVDLAVENWTSDWIVVEDAPGSTVRTADAEAWDLTWSGTPGDIPPGFRSRVDQDRQPLRVTGRMPAGSTAHQLELAYSAYPVGLDPVGAGYRGLRQTVSFTPPADPLSYPFLDAGGWEAYREHFSAQMLFLKPGEELTGPVFILSVDKVRFLPEAGPPGRFEFDLSVVNARGGNRVNLELEGDVWTSTGFAAPLLAPCRVDWGRVQECTIGSDRLAEAGGEPAQVCLLVRDLRWTVSGLSEHGSLGLPLLTCFP